MGLEPRIANLPRFGVVLGERSSRVRLQATTGGLLCRTSRERGLLAFVPGEAGKPVEARTVTTVQRRAADLFRFVAERFFETMPLWDPETLEVKPTSEGPVQVGATGRRISIGGGLRVESAITVTVYEPHRKFSFRVTGRPAGTYSLRGKTPEPMSFDLTFEFGPRGEETDAALRIEWDPAAIPWTTQSAVSATLQRGVLVMAERLRAITESSSAVDPAERWRDRSQLS